MESRKNEQLDAVSEDVNFRNDITYVEIFQKST